MGKTLQNYWDHEQAIIEVVCELMDQGYACYLEYSIPIALSKTKRGYHALVDIYAAKGKKEILIEVGTLSMGHGERIALLKKLMPQAKVIHVTQWKNFIPNLNYTMWMNVREHRFWRDIHQRKEDIKIMGRALVEGKNKT